MTGIYGNSAEDRHYEKMLHHHLAEQDDTAREEFIKQTVEGYLAAEYDPFSTDHVSEAMNEIHGGDLTILSAHMLTAHRNPQFQELQLNVSRVLLGAVVDYWTKQATAQAQVDWETRWTDYPEDERRIA